MRKRILAFICVLSFCFTMVLCVPASAAGTPVDFKDYEYGLDGNDKLTTVKLPVSWSYNRLLISRTTYTFTSPYSRECDDTATNCRFQFFPLGTSFSGNATYSGRYLDFANLPDDLTLTVYFHFDFHKESEDWDGGYFDTDAGYAYFAYYDTETSKLTSTTTKSWTMTKVPPTEDNSSHYTYLLSFTFDVDKQYDGAVYYFYSPYFDCSSNILYVELLESYLTFTIDYEHESWKDDQEIKDSLDGIEDAIEGTAAPVTPDGGSDVDDLGTAEDQLLDNVGGGLDNVGAAQGQASAGVSQYASGFAFLAAGIDYFAGELDWVSYLLYISLSVGTVGAILGIVPGIFHSKSSSGGIKKGGG